MLRRTLFRRSIWWLPPANYNWTAAAGHSTYVGKLGSILHLDQTKQRALKMRVKPDPIPPRHTFDDDSSSSSGGEDVDHSDRQVAGYQDGEHHDPPKKQETLPEAGDVTVSMTEEVQDSKAVVVGVELLRDVDHWFGHSQQVGTISTDASENTAALSIPVCYHSESDIYTLSIKHQPPLPLVPHLSSQILATFHPTNLVVLTSSTTVPSSLPISILRTSHHPKAIGGQAADFNPLFSNRGRVSRGDIQARLQASQNPAAHSEIPLLTPPNMIQGIAASLMEGAELHGIVGTCFIFSSWLGDGLDKEDVKRVVTKLGDTLRGVNISVDDVLKGWKRCLGSSQNEKSSIYL